MSISGIGGESSHDAQVNAYPVKPVPDKVVDAEAWLRTCIDQAIGNDTDVSASVEAWDEDGDVGAAVTITVYCDGDPAELGKVLKQLGDKLT